MQATVDKIILLPRYTAFAGATTFYTAPINVRAYGKTFVEFGFAGGLGSTLPSVTVQMQESPDLEIWEDLGAALVHDQAEERGFRLEWLRLKLVVTGSDPCFTCWCVGNFVQRETS